MLKTAMFIGCALFAASQAICANELKSEDGRVWPAFNLNGCSNVPPDGYFWVAVAYDSIGKSCQLKYVYTFESHFDKPVGHEMEICAHTVLPAGWYLIRYTESAKCTARRPGDPLRPALGMRVKKIS
jgi:hypothetical protein